MKSKKYLMLIVFSLLFTGSIYSQEEIGKIFTKAEADSLYGKVIESYTMSSDSLLGLLKEAGDKIMFRVKDNKAVITGSNRNPLYPKNAKVTQDEVLRVYSSKMVLELIATGRKEVVTIQLRESTTTIENGASVLELGFPCPPLCE